MSWEGYGQALCANGHQYTVQQYREQEGETCPVCDAPQAWCYWVDQTNGCYCSEEAEALEGRKCPAHPMPLELNVAAEYNECPTCKHKKLMRQPTYRIPNDDYRRTR